MIERISLNKGQILTITNIKKMLDSARSSFQYAKFIMHNGIYIIVYYNKDQTFEISTNSRNIQIYQQIVSLKRSYSQNRLCDFIFNWIQILNKN